MAVVVDGFGSTVEFCNDLARMADDSLAELVLALQRHRNELEAAEALV